MPTQREMAPPPMDDIGLLDFDRSNKGASKARRDQINAEIACMRDLLPLPESSRQRLSQLQIMSLTCVYIRKCNLLQKLFSQNPESKQTKQELTLPESLDFFQALTGFLLVTTREGKLLYISENVTDFLGHSMVDMKTQGDSLYDIVDKRDAAGVQTAMAQAAREVEAGREAPLAVFCRMNMSRTLKRQSGFGDVKIMHVRGHLSRVSAPGAPLDGQLVLMAVCSPLLTAELKESLVQNNTMVFKTVHQLDMSFLECSNTAEHHLGSSSKELAGRSWYSLIHPEDIREAKDKHVQLIRSSHEMGSALTLRLLRADGTSFWVNMVMHVRQGVTSGGVATPPGVGGVNGAAAGHSDEPVIVCINQVISAQEAYQMKVQSHMFSLYPTRAHEMWSSQLSSLPHGTHEVTGHGHWVAGHTAGHAGHGHPGYQTSVPGVLGPRGALYQLAARAGQGPYLGQQASKPAPIQATYNMVANPMLQTDKLKAMLKRKIQGPGQGQCRPSKLARLGTWMDEWGGHGTSGAGWGSDYAAERGAPTEGSYSHQVVMPVCIDSQGGQGLQVMQARMPLSTHPAANHQLVNCRGVVVPGMTVEHGVMSEQVVPEMSLPDSYLTPEPSPANSPQPGIKKEAIEPEDVKEPQQQSGSSSLHVEALVKLTSLAAKQSAQEKTTTNCEMQVSKAKDQFNAKRNLARADFTARSKAKRRELPELDPFDLDSFFDNLSEAKVAERVEQIKREIKTEVCCNDEEQSSSPKTENMPIPETRSIFQEEQLSSRREEIRSLSSPEGVASPSPSMEASSPRSIMASPGRVFAMSPASQTSGSPSHSDSGFDLLSCFGEEGLDLSPLQMHPRSSILDSSVSEEHESRSMSGSFIGSFYPEMGSACNDDLMEASSPASSVQGSRQASQDVSTAETSAFCLARALEELSEPRDLQPDLCDPCDLKTKALGVPQQLQELDFLLGAF